MATTAPEMPAAEAGRAGFVRKLLIILGTPIDTLNMTEALDRIDEFVAIGRATGRWHQIATINADFVVNSLRDPQLRWILQHADMATADGMPLVWGARLLSAPIEGRVTGIDLVNSMMERAAQRGYRIYLMGAAPGIAQRAADILRKRHTKLCIVGVDSPTAAAVAADDPSIVAACKATRPDILLVAFGNPKQEKWIAAHADELGVPVMVGVGGTFDFIAGVTQRAPEWMQQSGFEWLHRLISEPRRLGKRYAVDLVSFGYNFLRQWWLMHRGQLAHDGSNSVSISAKETDTSERQGAKRSVIEIRGRLDRGNLDMLVGLVRREMAVDPLIIVDLGGMTFLDSSAMGMLVALTKEARDRGGDLWLVNVPEQISRLLQLLKLDQFFRIYEDCEQALMPNGRPLRN